MHVSEKIRLLRKEKNLSQSELGKMIGGDARQISLYETKKIYPSSDAIVKIAKAFNVSIDYLLIEEAERRPLQLKKDRYADELLKLENLGEEDRESIIRIIDGLFTKTKIKELAISK